MRFKCIFICFMKCRDHLIPDDYGQLRILKERGKNKNIKHSKRTMHVEGEKPIQRKTTNRLNTHSSSRPGRFSQTFRISSEWSHMHLYDSGVPEDSHCNREGPLLGSHQMLLNQLLTESS